MLILSAFYSTYVNKSSGASYQTGQLCKYISKKCHAPLKILIIVSIKLARRRIIAHKECAHRPTTDYPKEGLAMQTRPVVSILVSDLEAHPSMPRLLQSIARQSTGLSKVEILIAGCDAPGTPSLDIWSAITGSTNISFIPIGEEASPAQARNHAASNANGDFLLFLRPDYRLDPKYMTTALSVFDDYPEADVMYPDYIRLAPANDRSITPGMVQLPEFDQSLLQTNNILGPAVIMRREAFERTEGFRDNTLYRDWDMWVQAANTGSSFLHVDYPLASCEHAKISFRDRAEDGRNKAMIVINNQSYFHMHTVRWALGYLRGDAWALAHNFMTLPSAMEVTRMMHEYHMKAMGTDRLAEKAIRQFDISPSSVEAAR